MQTLPMTPLTLLCFISSLLIPSSNAVYLYSGRWTQWAWTNGDSSIKYIFPDDEHEINSFVADATSIKLHNSGSTDYTIIISKGTTCFPSYDDFNIDTVLQCDGDSGIGGWGGLFYKNDTMDWSHLSADFWVQIATNTLEPTPYDTPAPQAVFLSTNSWTEWAYTNGDEGGVEYNFRYGVNQLYSFNADATEMIFKQQPDRHQYELDADDMCWPGQNFNIDEVLLCVDVEQSGSSTTGWAGIYYKSGVSGSTSDWSDEEAQFAVYVHVDTDDPTMDPTVEPTYDPTIDPTLEPTFDPTDDPTRDPTAAPTDDPTQVPTWDPTKVPTIDPTHPTQCFIGSECSKTMECCPDHIDPRDEGITCACKSELSTKIKFCCLKHGASGCVDNDDCCGGKHTCFEGVCLNRKTHHQVNPKPHKRLLLQELDDV
eukprot:89504_1